MADESRDLKNEDGTAISDFLDMMFGAGMILAPLAAIAKIAWNGSGWGAYLVWIILFLIGSAVGGMMMREGWKNLRNRRQKERKERK